MKSKAKIEIFLTSARKYLGYTSEALGGSGFASKVGYSNKPWSGAFIDVVARAAGLDLPSFTYVPAALAEFLRTGNISRRPRPGDIAIFNFSSTSDNGGFGMQHAGIVTDVRELRTNGRFLTIEGNVTGTSAYQNKDGVHQRIRHVTDVVVFCRPEEFQGGRLIRRSAQLLTKWILKLFTREARAELKAIEAAAASQETVRSKLVRPGTRNKDIELVQLALSQVTDIRGAERGKWDGSTSAAFARFQRNIGRVGPDATGMPDQASLQRLASETRIFTINE